jgi:hypothetical protein
MTPSLQEMVSLAVLNPGLQVLWMGISSLEGQHTAQLQRLFSSCTSLTSLDLGGSKVNGEALRALLTFGTSITSLTVRRPVLPAMVNMARTPCSWQELTVCDSH